MPPLAERQQPGLSETLNGGERHPNRCQSCGYPNLFDALPPNIEMLVTWSECDEWDRPQRPPVLVVLCRPCSDRLIDSHPRLYHRVDRRAPVPGIMDLCVDCRWRKALQCVWPGFEEGKPRIIQHPEPVIAHLNYGGGRGEFKKLYQGPPTSCSAREVA